MASHPDMKTIIKLKRDFFMENISSSVTRSSELHEIFCSDTNSISIDLAKNNEFSDIASKPTIENVHNFFHEMTQMYEPSLTIFKVLSSCTYSIFTFFSQRNEMSEHFEAIGWIAYICDPNVGLLILFVHVKKEFRKQGIGTAMM